jgi:uncharacterized membrane protein YadS
MFSLGYCLGVATVTKLVRNVFMAAVIPSMAYYYANRTAGSDQPSGKQSGFVKLLPLFVVGFLILAILRSVGDAGINASGRAFALWEGAAWGGIHSVIKNWSVNLLGVALAGVGLNTRFRILKGLGATPFVVGLGAALIVGVISFVAISLLATFVTL